MHLWYLCKKALEGGALEGEMIAVESGGGGVGGIRELDARSTEAAQVLETGRRIKVAKQLFEVRLQTTPYLASQFMQHTLLLFTYK